MRGEGQTLTHPPCLPTVHTYPTLKLGPMGAGGPGWIRFLHAAEGGRSMVDSCPAAFVGLSHSPILLLCEDRA